MPYATFYIDMFWTLAINYFLRIIIRIFFKKALSNFTVSFSFLIYNYLKSSLGWPRKQNLRCQIKFDLNCTFWYLDLEHLNQNKMYFQLWLFPVSCGCFGPSGPISLFNWRSDLLIIPGSQVYWTDSYILTYFVWMPYVYLHSKPYASRNNT